MRLHQWSRSIKRGGPQKQISKLKSIALGCSVACSTSCTTKTPRHFQKIKYTLLINPTNYKLPLKKKKNQSNHNKLCRAKDIPHHMLLGKKKEKKESKNVRRQRHQTKPHRQLEAVILELKKPTQSPQINHTCRQQPHPQVLSLVH